MRVSGQRRHFASLAGRRSSPGFALPCDLRATSCSALVEDEDGHESRRRSPPDRDGGARAAERTALHEDADTIDRPRHAKDLEGDRAVGRCVGRGRDVARSSSFQIATASPRASREHSSTRIRILRQSVSSGCVWTRCQPPTARSFARLSSVTTPRSTAPPKTSPIDT
jgi:hypothetical protein